MSVTLFDLPDVVLDRIFDWLVRPGYLGREPMHAYASLSRSCKALHESANRYLYRSPYRPTLKTFNSLIKYPWNAKFVRYLAPEHDTMDLFLQLWSNESLALISLDLTSFIGIYPGESKKIVRSTRPDTRVEYICLNLSCEVNEAKRLLRQCYKFDTLRSLTVELEFTFSNRFTHRLLKPQDVVDNLNCPKLEHLITRHGEDSIIVLGDKLPSLRSLHQTSLPSPMPIETLWGLLTAMMDRGVYFSSTGVSIISSFYPEILAHASQLDIDPEALVRWIFLGEHDFHLRTVQARARQTRCPESLNMQVHFQRKEWTATALQTTLELLSPIYPPANYRFHINLYPQFTPSIANLLPLDVVCLGLCCLGTINPAVVHACIAGFPRLRRLAVQIIISAEDGGCTTAPIPPSWDRPPRWAPQTSALHMKMERGEKPIWEFSEEIDDPPVTYPESREMGSEADEFEMEIGGWFRLNDSLKKLTIQFREAGREYNYENRFIVQMYSDSD
jgi:hypothetical protein